MNKQRFFIIIAWVVFLGGFLAFFILTIQIKTPIPSFSETSLNEEQQGLRNIFLNTKIKPTVMMSASGHETYFVYDEANFTIRFYEERPEWFSTDGRVILTEEEEKQIANLSTIKTPWWLGGKEVGYKEIEKIKKWFPFLMVAGLVFGLVYSIATAKFVDGLIISAYIFGMVAGLLNESVIGLAFGLSYIITYVLFISTKKYWE